MLKIYSTRLRRVSAAALLLLGLLPVSSCEKIEDIITPKLPEATQEGKGTFGCLVDNALWLPYVQHTLDSKVEADYSSVGGGIFHLRAEQEHEGKAPQYVHLIINNPANVLLTTGTYTVKQGFEGRLEVQNTPTTNYVSATGGSGQITLTKVEPHTEKVPTGGEVRYTIIAGTFDFEATDANGQKVKITDGRFDVKAY